MCKEKRNLDGRGGPRRTPARNIRQVEADKSFEEELELLRVEVNAATNTKTPAMMVKMTAKTACATFSNVVRAIPDTGAEVSIAGRGLLDKLGLKKGDMKKSEHESLCAANDTKIKVIGKMSVKIEYEGQESTEDVLICDTKKNDILLSWKCC